MDHYLYAEFLHITKQLNKELSVIPVLYGSLGLSKITNIDFSSQDIDFLVPLEYLENEWDLLKKTVEELDYQLINIHEHEFIKEDIHIQFGFTEDLHDFANIDYEKLELIYDQDAHFYVLTIRDYLKVYEESSQDSYRREKNNRKDLNKIKVIYQILSESK